MRTKTFEGVKVAYLRFVHVKVAYLRFMLFGACESVLYFFVRVKVFRKKKTKKLEITLITSIYTTNNVPKWSDTLLKLFSIC